MAIYPCPAAEDDRQEPCSTAFAAVSGLDAVAGADNGSPGRGHGEACTASELDAWSVSCGLAGSAGWGKIAVRVCPPAVLDHDSALRVAGPPGTQPGVQGGGDHGPAS